MQVQILAHTPDPEKVVAMAAKLCYSDKTIGELGDSLDEEAINKFIKRLIDLGHESPVEHVSFTFGIEGVSRALLAQITRHRIASFSVQSQRYVGMKNFEYVLPPEIESIPEAKEEFLKAMEEDAEHYESLRTKLISGHFKKNLEAGMDEASARRAAEKQANEDARFVLPNACTTRLIVTMNVRELFKFFSLRCCNRAQWEIRAVADEMLRQVRMICPILFRNAGPSCLTGKCSEGAMTCGKPRNDLR